MNIYLLILPSKLLTINDDDGNKECVVLFRVLPKVVLFSLTKEEVLVSMYGCSPVLQLWIQLLHCKQLTTY